MDIISTTGSTAGRIELPAAPPSKAPAAPTPAPTVAAVANAGAAIDPAELKKSVGEINQALKSSNIEFSIDPDSGTTLVKVVDKETQKLIRQIPTEEALSIARQLSKLQGLLVHDQA